MKDDFNNDKNNTGRINKPVQEITDKELAQKIELYAGLAPNDKERFQVLRFHQNYISLKHSREKNQIERGYWFSQGQRIGLNQGKTLADERSNQDKLLGHARKATFKDIKELYHQNYSTSKSFNTEASIKMDKDNNQQKREELGKPIEVYNPNGELNEKNLKAFINNVSKLNPEKEKNHIIERFYQTTLKNAEVQTKLNNSINNWVRIYEANGLHNNPEFQQGNAFIQQGKKNNDRLLEELDNKTKNMVKNFYHQNYSVSKSFNEVGKEKPKDKGLDMDKG